MVGICAGYLGLLLISGTKNGMTQLRSVDSHLYGIRASSLRSCKEARLVLARQTLVMVGSWLPFHPALQFQRPVMAELHGQGWKEGGVCQAKSTSAPMTRLRPCSPAQRLEPPQGWGCWERGLAKTWPILSL